MHRFDVQLGYTLYGTPGTASYYGKLGLKVEPLAKPTAANAAAHGGEGGMKTSTSADSLAGRDSAMVVEGDTEDEKVVGALDLIKAGKIDLVINIPEGSRKDTVISDGYLLRRTTVDFGVSLVTNVKVAKLLVESERKHRDMTAKGIEVGIKTIKEFYVDGMDV